LQPEAADAHADAGAETIADTYQATCRTNAETDTYPVADNLQATTEAESYTYAVA
jgi:hypothetical protein